MYNKHKNVRLTGGVLARIIGYLFRYYKLRSIIVFFLIILHAVTGVAAAVLLQFLIDDYLIPAIGAGAVSIRPVLYLIGIMALVYYLGIACHYIYSRMIIKITRGTTRNFRVELFSHMEKLPLRYFDTRSHGDLMSVFSNDTDTLRQLISQSIPQLVSSTVVILGAVTAMAALNIPLLCISLTAIFLMLLIGRKLTEQSSRYFARQQDDFGVLNGYIEEMLEGQKEIKLFGQEQKNVNAFKKLNQNLADSAVNANSRGNLLTPLVSGLSNAAYAGTALAGVLYIGRTDTVFTLGMLASFLQLSKMLYQPVTQISRQVGYIVTASAGAVRMFALMDEEPEENNGKIRLVPVRDSGEGCLSQADCHTGRWGWKTEAGVLIPFCGTVKLQGVSFGYTDDKLILHDIGLQVNAGEKAAFVGPTGAGKTTIANLLNRFYDVRDGAVFIDGFDIREVDKTDLRQIIGMVLQDTRLFAGSIRENIRFGRADATDEEVVAAANTANAHKFIMDLKAGYDTVLISNGKNLSEGERQLITIARAVIANTPILVLDEATASVDTRTESMVQKGLANLMKDRTVFLIAHRLSTIRSAEKIMVMQAGRIVESGSHEELLGRGGLYANLYRVHLNT